LVEVIVSLADIITPAIGAPLTVTYPYTAKGTPEAKAEGTNKPAQIIRRVDRTESRNTDPLLKLI
jgi:hypothetical protein